MSLIKEIYNYRTMVKSIVNKELRVRYRGSLLGFLWTFINPLLQLIVYSLIFPYVLKFQIENYAMFMFVCLVPWIFLNSTILGSCGLILGNSNIVTKIYFPRIILPISYTLTGFINMLLSFLIVIPMLLIFNIEITWKILLLLPLFLILLIIAMGFSMIFSSINVYFRDTEHIMGILTMALYFFTPIIYSLDMFSQDMQKYFHYNPLTDIMIAIRDVSMYGKMFDAISLIYPTVFAVFIFIIGTITFQKLQKKFAEVM